jgi:N4-gp56 family major capsid protein
MASDFATNPTTTTTYDDVSYAAIITDEVKDALMATVVTPALLDYHELAGEPSVAVKIPKADKFTAAAVAEGTELANTALTSGSVTITSSEIGIMATITDVLELSDIPAAHGARLKQLGRSIGDKMDVDICALLGDFTAAAGSSGVNIALTNFLDAIYNLEVNDAAGLGSLVGVLHPRQTADLRTEFEADAASLYVGSSDSRISKSMAGYFGSWFEIDIFQSTNVPTANAGADRAGGVFVRGYALGMAHKWSAKVETMRWAPIRGWVLVATAMYGVDTVEDNAGVEAVTDA